jgi:hypothetical protein
MTYLLMGSIDEVLQVLSGAVVGVDAIQIRCPVSMVATIDI